MQKNDNQFSIQEVMKLANSPAGKQLIALLQQADPQAMQKAMTLAARGDYDKIPQVLSSLKEMDEVKKLMKDMGGGSNG